MNRDLIKEASECLAIQDVRLNNSNISVADTFDPLFPAYDSLNIQFRHGIKSHRVNEVSASGEDGPISQKLVLYTYACGIRVVPPVLGADVLSEIEADFVAYYLIVKEISDDAIKQFGIYNVGYHVWPYWREYVSSVATRLRLPPLTIPMYTIPKVDDAEDMKTASGKRKATSEPVTR